MTIAKTVPIGATIPISSQLIIDKPSLMTTINRLTRQALFFPLALVLFEFTVYIANDMIQPGMLMVVNSFHASTEWVSASMTAYLAGGIILQWLLGPLSDRRGRRLVLFSGIIYFILMSLLIIFSQTIGQFIAVRFLQGISLSFIGAVGYAAIQESFSEQLCIKITALMSNVALLAPLLGPLAGAAVLHTVHWHSLFIFFALVASIALIGLWRTMPETAPRLGEPLSLAQLGADYRTVFGNLRFVFGALALGFASLPMLTWIAQSPVILINGEKLTNYQYGLLQIPVFGALIIGNITLSKIIHRYSSAALIKQGLWPIMLGLLVASLATVYHPHAYLLMTIGLSLYAFGIGIANACLYRLTLFASEMSKGTVSAIMGMLSMLIFSLGIEITKYGYFIGGNPLFNLCNLISGLLFLLLTLRFLNSPDKAVP